MFLDIITFVDAVEVKFWFIQSENKSFWAKKKDKINLNKSCQVFTNLANQHMSSSTFIQS